MEPAQQSSDTAPLLARLKNTVYNPEIILEPVFDESMYPDRKEALRRFQADCCAVFEALYKLTAECWNESHSSGGDDGGPSIDCLGVELFEMCNKMLHRELLLT